MDLALNNLQWLICHKTKPNHSQSTQGLVFWAELYVKVSENFMGLIF